MTRRRYIPGCTACGDSGAVVVDLEVQAGLAAERYGTAHRRVEVAYRCSCGAGSRYPNLPLAPDQKQRRRFTLLEPAG